MARSVTPPLSSSQVSQGGKKSILKQSFRANGSTSSDLIAKQLRSNNDRQGQIEKKAAQINQLFTQMLDQCLPGQQPH